MSDPLILIKAIRSGSLAEVKALLDSGAAVELQDGVGDPGMPMGVACFMGFVDIVRELAVRGAKVNLPDNAIPISPLNMAVRGGRIEVVRALVELGAEVPADMKTGLSEQDLMLAQWKAQRDGKAPRKMVDELPEFEEIEVSRCAGTDTQVLEADILRAARDMR